MDQPNQSLDRASDWLSKVLSTTLSYAIVWPKTTALSSLSVIALILVVCIIPWGPPDKPPPPSEWRIQQMMNAVQQADQRVRAQLGLDTAPEEEFRGVFETMRDQTEPPPSTQVPQVSEFKP